MNETENKQQDQGVIKNNSELDTTLLVMGGLIIAALVVCGTFALHFVSPANTLLSPEILMALIMLPSTIISFAMGKKSGRTEIQQNPISTHHQTQPKQEEK